MRPEIDIGRLQGRLRELARFGATPEGGVSRLALTEEDRAGRDLVATWMRDLGLRVRVDAIGNIHAVRAGAEDRRPVMTGSHIDTVINGGALDGSYGVLAGLEVMAALNEADTVTRRPVGVSVFTNEEGVRFQPDMMGSLVCSGGLDVADALGAADRDGITVADALKGIGYAGEEDPRAMRPAAYLELHIEQGPVLESEGKTIGVVENLQGISWTEIILEGEANHAGTTPMHLRRDAGLGAARICRHVRALAEGTGGNQVATVGVMELSPNAINVIPGRARMTVDLRNTDESRLREAEHGLGSFIQAVADEEGLAVSSERLARFEPVVFDKQVTNQIAAQAERLGYGWTSMTSGAGHDAQMMARICPTAMIFVPSVAGVSHNPAERTSPADLHAGASVLLHTMLALAD